MSLPQGTLSDAKRISSSLSRAQNLLEASLSQAETATGALDRDGNTIKVLHDKLFSRLQILLSFLIGDIE